MLWQTRFRTFLPLTKQSYMQIKAKRYAIITQILYDPILFYFTKHYLSSHLMILMNMFSVTEFIFPPSYTLNRRVQIHEGITSSLIAINR